MRGLARTGHCGAARRGSMDLSHLLAAEWRPALGCTEPAAIAYAAASAAAQAAGEVRHVRLVCDPRIYKNCYAVGIPNSGHRTGILWALAIGALLEDASCKLECFRGVGASTLQGAADLIARGALTVEVERGKKELYVDCTVERAGGAGRAVLEREHTRLVRLERDGTTLPLEVEPGGRRHRHRPRLGRVPVVCTGDRGGARRRRRRSGGPAARGGVQPGDRRARRCRSCPKASCVRSRPTG